MSRYSEVTNRDRAEVSRSYNEQTPDERSDYRRITGYAVGRESVREFPRRSTAFSQRYGVDTERRYESRRDISAGYAPYDVRNLQRGIYFACAEFSHETGIEVSRAAQSLIHVILEAIILDPHPRWNVSEDYRMVTVGRFISDLPLILEGVARQERVRREMTSFDVLHYLSVELDGLCLFK